MKTNMLYLSIAVFSITITSIGAQNPQRQIRQTQPTQQTRTAPAGKGTIEGTVTRSDNGQPVKGARVALRRGGNNALTNGVLAGLGLSQNQTAIVNALGSTGNVTTDSNGQFSFKNVDAGSYQVIAEREGFVRSEYGQRTPSARGLTVALAANQNLKVDLKMLQASVVSGRVMNADGQPAQATVQAYTYQYNGGQRTLAQVKTTQTNDLGEYRLFWLQPGEYFVSVTSDEVTEDGPVGTVDLGERGRGGITDAAGLQALLGGRAALAGQSGGNGNIPFYYPGTIDPSAATPLSVAAGTDARGVDFNLRPTRAPVVSGRIDSPFPLNAAATAARGGRGAAGGLGGIDVGTIAQLLGGNASGVQISLNRVGGSRRGFGGLLALGGTPVNADGTFSIKGVSPGEYTLTATARDPNNQEFTGRTRVNVGNSDVSNVVVSLRAGVEVRGKITLDGTPPQNFKMTSLRVSLVGEGGPLGDVANLVAAAVTSGLTRAGGNAAAGGDGQRAAGGQGGGQAGGQGRAGRGGALANLAAGQASLGQVAEDGSFTLQNVGAMEYRIRVAGLPQGAYLEAGRIDSTDALNGPITIDGGALLQLQIGFTAGRVTGVVTDDKKTPVAGVQAVLVPDENRRGRTDAYFTANTDQSGQFNINNVPPGRYKIFAWEDIPSGAYQYPDFIRQYEDRGQQITITASSAATADVRLIPSN